MCNGLVMIYMGPDGGVEYEQMWGTLRGDNATEATVRDTLCRQLGYNSGGHMQLKPFPVSPRSTCTQLEYRPEM